MNNSPRNSIISTSKTSTGNKRNSVVAVATSSRISHLTGGDDVDNSWDDTLIGHIMNLVDSIGDEQEVVMSNNLPKTRIVNGSSSSSGNNQSVRKEHQKTDSGFAQIPEECRALNSQISETPAQEYARIMRSSSSASESESRQVSNKTEHPPSAETKKSESVGQKLRRTASNLSRRSSIHGRKSVDDDKSISSRVSRVSKVEKIAEAPEEESNTGNNGRKFFPVKKKRASSNFISSKSDNGFLRKFFKSKIDQVANLNKTLSPMTMREEEAIDADDQSVGGGVNSINSTSSNIDTDPVSDGSSMTEEEWQKVFKACEEQGVSLLRKKHNYGIRGGLSGGVREFGNDNYYTSMHNGANSSKSTVTDEGEDGSDTGHSNFYLKMPNGQWMVRTRTASRKIIGTQYVDIDCI